MPSFNPDRAEVPLALPGGPTLKLVLDWNTAGALQAKFGDEWDSAVAKAFSSYDCRTIAQVVEILAAKEQPEVTADQVMAFSPPMVTTINAINAAQNVFLFGRAGPQPKEEGDEAEYGEEASEDDPLGRRKRGPVGPKSSDLQWWRLFRRVWGPQSSGA